MGKIMYFPLKRGLLKNCLTEDILSLTGGINLLDITFVLIKDLYLEPIVLLLEREEQINF